MTRKVYHKDKKTSPSNNFLFKNTFKVPLQYLFNVVILFKTVFYPIFNLFFKCFLTWKKLRKPGEKLQKNTWQPEYKHRFVNNTYFRYTKFVFSWKTFYFLFKIFTQRTIFYHTILNYLVKQTFICINGKWTLYSKSSITFLFKFV